MARPKSDDPKERVTIFVRRSVMDRVRADRSVITGVHTPAQVLAATVEWLFYGAFARADRGAAADTVIVDDPQ